MVDPPGLVPLDRSVEQVKRVADAPNLDQTGCAATVAAA